MKIYALTDKRLGYIKKMSAILTTRLKNHIESAIKDSLDLSDCHADESKILSRGIVAICISGLSSLPYASISNFITDGSRDNGIDGVYYDNARNKLYIIQAKWSNKGTGTIDTGDLRKFIAGVYDLLNEDWNKFNDKFAKISSIISDGIRKDPEIILVATYNSDNPISSDCKIIVDNFTKENNTEFQEVVTFKTYGLSPLIRAMKSNKSGEKTDVDINLLQWGEQTEPYYAIYGKVSCADVAEWYKVHEELLFSENIRSSLTDSIINSQIESTVTNSPADFWYLNNGITAIADGVSRKPIGLGDQRDSSYWGAKNIKIVNGAQTTSSISRAYKRDPSKVRKAYVQIKIISLEKAPIDIATRITTATNTQNRVEAKDFLALEPTQDGLAEAFKKMGIQYCFRRGEKVLDLTTGLDVQDLAMCLAVSSDINSVVIAKRNAGFLTDLNEYYPKIFGSPINALAAWQKVQQWRIATDELSKFASTLSGRQSQLAVHGNRFIEHLLMRMPKNHLNQESLKNEFSRLNAVIDDLFGSECYLAVLFKNTNKCQSILETLDGITPSATKQKRQASEPLTPNQPSGAS